MARISLAGFKDPVRRPRYIIWTGVAVLMLAAVMIVALGVTSSYWFCSEACHKVQDDTITAYDNSSHSKVSCMACHMPVNADPFTFILHKGEALGELILTVSNDFEIPLNGTSHLAMDGHLMGSKQCTQCHSSNRVITASEGIIIDHEVHEEAEVHCTVCHNRVAHNEDGIEFINIDPETDVLNVGHNDFMEMTACFRCHSLESDALAPGACRACHSPDFELKPDSHFEGDFYPGGHAELALAEFGHGEDAEGEEGHEEAAEDGEAHEGEGIDLHTLPSVDEVNYCSTCHVIDQFCMNCHGMEMPHPEEFKGGEDATHPSIAAEKFDKCELCHAPAETSFCDSCHHGDAVDWEYDAAIVWQTQHAASVSTNGVAGCLDKCHEVKFCSDCHTALNPVPSSHGAADWLRKPVDEVGAHAESARAEITACEVCHGSGGPNAAFCKSCHVEDMPHPEDFKSFHAKTGRDNPVVCANCHTFKELCSDCHHVGSVDGTPWTTIHAGVIAEDGAEGCFEKCHQKDYCVQCHTSTKVVPASHAGSWTFRPSLSTPAKHPEAYSSQPENCTYCHGEGGPASDFCMSCHKLEMPHPGEFQDVHGEQITSNTVTRAVCATCHSQAACSQCHHPSYTDTARPWVNVHPGTVRETGAAACFECHEETYCSYCHVREAQKYIGN